MRSDRECFADDVKCVLVDTLAFTSSADLRILYNFLTGPINFGLTMRLAIVIVNYRTADLTVGCC